MVITRKTPKKRRDLKIFLNNKKLQEDTIKYLGTTIDEQFNFNEHIENNSEMYKDHPCPGKVCQN